MKHDVMGASATTQRRHLLQLASALALASASPSGFTQPAAGRKIKIGYVTPQTGPLAGFGEGDAFVLSGINWAFKNGLAIAGKKHPVEILVRDSESKANRAAEAAAELILKDRVDLMLVGSTPENTNPVSVQCERYGIPCISTTSPWQSWFFGSGGDPKKGFDWAYHFFWGLEDIIAVFTNMWKDIPTNKVVGLLLANDADGSAWGDAQLGLPPALTAKGFTVINPGRYQPMQLDFSAQISAFKKANVEIVCGVPTPPDFKTFWTQARQQGFKPKAVTMGKAFTFPSAVEELGDTADGLTQEAWWSPNLPFSSSLIVQSARQFAAAYEAHSKKPWNMAVGYTHAIFEVAADVLKRTKDVENKASIRDAILETRLDTLIGRVSWKSGPVKNVSRTPLVGGQWVKGRTNKYELLIVNNESAPFVPLDARIRAMAY
ncbi:MAG: ABC transporter substrate-binding protein [Pseudomonadota bacterium]|nr:ABC transporter substrate-binding protein [Pseudomonadota bacterium]